jgi:hypothetical protein
LTKLLVAAAGELVSYRVVMSLCSRAADQKYATRQLARQLGEILEPLGIRVSRVPRRG